MSDTIVRRLLVHRPSRLALLATVWLLAIPHVLGATVPESSHADLRWRLAGPFRGGWATAVAGHPDQAATFYFGGADGGVWRTDDAGSTWHPIFERGGSASIGALTLAPSDPNVIWVGTGQIQQRWDIVDGDGVYRSTDSGASWTHVGLDDTKHIGALWVDPRDADIAVVAALGHVFGPSEQRGLFRTEDGGRSWKPVLHRDANVGAVDIAGALDTPDVLYASLWEVRRHPWLDYFQPTLGVGSGIYRSTDAGRRWTIVEGSGLPDGPLGRIELAVAADTAAQRVWASVEAGPSSGLYLSEDGGASWTRINDDGSLAGNYMGWIAADPQDGDTVWAGGQPLRRSTDRGRSFTIVRSSPGGDDYHALWIDPRDSRRMITGADQGAVVTFNGGVSWSSWYNQPTGQFYRLAVDHEFPYHIYSGQQDSGSVRLASRSDYGQLTFRDWIPVGADERDGDVPDPTDPEIVYGAGLGGRVSRWDARTGQVTNVSPWPVSSYAERPGTTRYRYDWITPLAVSTLPPHALYVGAQVLFRSLDGGTSWDTISPDLTGAAGDAGDCSGDVPVERATACGYGTIFAIAPSPAVAGTVWIGTTNGRVQLTRDDGKTWSDVTPHGLGDWSKVNFVDPSASDPATALVSADRHRLDDVRPLVFLTHDFGATWTELSDGLPRNEWVGVARIDPDEPRLLYAGTNRGVHVSFDGGVQWQPLQQNLPTTGINDLLVHEDDLIVATQGRAIWILDEVAPLRRLVRPLDEGPQLVRPSTAWRVRFNANRDTPLPPEEPRGENPPVGAVLDYILPPDSPGPVVLEIRDSAGSLVRRFASNEEVESRQARVYVADVWLNRAPSPGDGPGHHRFVWDLRYQPPPTVRASYSIAAVPHLPTPIVPRGALVLPGRYEVTLVADGRRVMQPLEVALDPRAASDPDGLVALADFQRAVAAALGRAVDLDGRIARAGASIEALLADRDSPDGSERLDRAHERLEGVRGSGQEALSSLARALAGLATDLETGDRAPTDPQRELLAFAEAGLEGIARRWADYVASVPAGLQGEASANDER